MGGNGRESRFCVCAPLRPRKTRPQRRWDLISVQRQETSSSGEGGGGAGALHSMSSQREESVNNSPPRLLVSGGRCTAAGV